MFVLQGGEIMSELGALLKELRGKESLREASKRTGLSHTYLGIIEKGYDPRSGKPVKPTPETLKLLSEAYDYPYEKLMEIAGYLEGENREELQSKQQDKPINMAFLGGRKEVLTDDEAEALELALEIHRRNKEKRRSNKPL